MRSCRVWSWRLKRTIWQMGDVELRDGGADGVASTQDNTLFARQGIFVP